MYQGQLALVLKFSQRLAGARAFDGLAGVNGLQGEAVASGSWALDEDGKLLRFPFVQADGTHTVHVKGELAAADGRTPAAALQKDVTPDRWNRPWASPRRAACCRRASRAACRWCR